MNREELNNQVNRMLSFKENESNKVIALKKHFTSYKFIGLIISLIFYSIIIFAYTITSNIFTLTSIDASNITSIVFSSLVELIFPLYFAYYLYKIYKLSKSNDLNDANPKKSLLNNIFILRRILKVILIIASVFLIFDGISYIGISNLYYSNPEQFNTMITQYGLTLDEKAVLTMRELGYQFIIYGCLIALLAFSSLRCFKKFFLIIFNDKIEDTLLDAYLTISFVIIYGLLHIVGSILGMCGITNYLGGTGTNNLTLNILDIVDSLALGTIMGFIAYNIFEIIKILKNNEGSANPLSNDKDIYTINIDE